MTDNGLITIASRHDVKTTIDRLEAVAKAKGLTIFARIDHAAGAAAVGMSLRPTELLIFGNAKGGTPLMQAQQTVGIDLPLKALAFEDAAGKTSLCYDDLAFVAARPGLSGAGAEIARVLGGVLATLCRTAAGMD